jgi:hypothetical protein
MTEPRLAVMRTSDRGSFKRCRRQWAWGSPLRQNLTIKDTPSYFWIGTGGHFAMEDYHGWNRFKHPVEAFNAYVNACKKAQAKYGHGLPDDWEEQTEMATGILLHYLQWAVNRDTYQTAIFEGVPQVEVTFHVPLPFAPPPGFDQVVYQFTLDRLVVIDEEYWILDWKFYKNFSQADLEVDQQLSAYIWAAQACFEVPIAGAILHEFRKKLPQEPKILSTGKLSTAENQGTTHGMYRNALIEMYGDVSKAPHANVACLNKLGAKETEDRDDFIRRSKTRRTEMQIQAEGTKIMMELEDMCNPNLPLYPNPTSDCSWDCQLRDVCLMMDRDDDWEFALKELTVSRETEAGEWREFLEYPE